MFISYFKAEPTEYILAYANGKVFCQGAGLVMVLRATIWPLILVPLLVSRWLDGKRIW